MDLKKILAISVTSAVLAASLTGCSEIKLGGVQEGSSIDMPSAPSDIDSSPQGSDSSAGGALSGSAESSSSMQSISSKPQSSSSSEPQSSSSSKPQSSSSSNPQSGSSSEPQSSSSSEPQSSSSSEPQSSSSSEPQSSSSSKPQSSNSSKPQSSSSSKPQSSSSSKPQSSSSSKPQSSSSSKPQSSSSGKPQSSSSSKPQLGSLVKLQSGPSFVPDPNEIKFTGFSAVKTANGTKLSWNPVKNCKEYYVYRADSEGCYMLDILKNDETSFLDSGTSDIEDITYYIEAIVTENGKPAVYASNTATIPGKIKAPGVALTIGNGKATLNWSKENADGYIVLMDGKPIYDTHSGSVTSYTKTGLTNYELHCFSVKAYKNINGKTAYGPKSKSVLTRDCSVILDSARTNNTRSFSLINRQGAADTTSTVYLSDNDFAIMEKFAKEHFTAGMSDFEKLVTTLDWIGQNLSYAQGSDWNKIAGRSYVDAVFNYKLGQCAQYNGTMVSMLRYLGYNANLILGWRGNAQGYKTQHLWGEVDIDGTRYIVEAGGFGASFLSPYEMSDGRYIMNNKNAPWQELNDSYEESDFEYRAYSDAYISGYKGKDSAVKIPAVLNGAEVTLIAFDTFSDRADITSVMIPNTVKEIKSDAFKGCTGLTSIMIPTSVTSMWDGVFSNCTGLTSIILPPGVKSVGASTFSGCTGLKSITLPDGITKIYDKTFWDCSSLESITIPEGVKEIGYGAFLRCASLTSVTIPGSVEKIRDSAFQNCVGLTSIKIPDGVKIIEEETFQGCSGLISVTIPNSVTSIENQAFYECTGLADITIPDSVTKIGTHVFTWCENIQATYKGNTYDYEHIDDLYKAING